MPTYEYKCPKCGKLFELFQKMSDKAVAKCPKCGTKADRLLSGGGGLVFKGSGFYLTDYGRAGQKPHTDSGSAEKSTEKSDKPAADKKPAEAKPKKKKGE